MLEVQICVGSSCHIKGSYYIINTIQDLVKKHRLESKVVIKAAFCLGHCTEGVAVKIGDTIAGGFTPSNVEQRFEELILGRV